MAIEFTVDHDHTAITDVGEEQLIGNIYFTVQTRPGDFRVRNSGAPSPRTINLPRRTAYLAIDGHLYKDQAANEPFRLVANDPAFNLDHITYRADFELTNAVGEPFAVPSCYFPAPSTDTTLYLTRVMNDVEQAVMEVRTKGYAEDILDASAVGIDLLTAANGAAARAAIGVDLIDLDEIAPFTNRAAFPATGVANVLYIALDTGVLYRWNGVDDYFVATQPSLNPTAVKTSAYTASPGDMIPVDASAGGVTISLPDHPVDKAVIFVKKLDSSTNPVTIQRLGTDVFNQTGGATSMQLVLQDQTVALQYKKSSRIWYVTAHGVPVAANDARYLTPAGSGDNLKFTRLLDTNGNKILDLVAVAAAINYVRIYNGAGAVGPIIQPGGSTNVPLYIALPGTGKLYVWSQTANTPTIAALGSGTDADLLLESQGTGLVKANGNRVFTSAVVHAATEKATPADADEFAIIDSASGYVLGKTTWADIKAAIAAATMTETNKTLTTPKVDSIKDINGNTILAFSAQASAVNYLQLLNGASSSGPILQAVGTGTNLSMFLWLKGSGQLYVYSPNNTPVIQGWGPGADIDLILQGTGAGKVKAQMAPRVVSAASAAALTPSVATADLYAYTALAAALTINAPTGTPADGQRMRYRIKDNGSSQTLTFNAIFRAIGVTLPAATTAGKVMYIDTAYNAAETVWDVTDVKIQA